MISWHAIASRTLLAVTLRHTGLRNVFNSRDNFSQMYCRIWYCRYCWRRSGRVTQTWWSLQCSGGWVSTRKMVTQSEKWLHSCQQLSNHPVLNFTMFSSLFLLHRLWGCWLTEKKRHTFAVFTGFYRATACNAMHGIAVAVLSVRLSVCPSVKCVYRDKTK